MNSLQDVVEESHLPIGSVQQVYDGALFPDIQARTFRHIDRLFPTRAVGCGNDPMLLPKGEPLGNFVFQSRGVDRDLYDYLALNRVSGLLVLQDGRVRLEHYALGNTERTRWMSMSVAKSITSTLVGVALREGHIKSLDDAVTDYLPVLAGSAYDGVSVRHVLQMASGVAWNETYIDPSSDRRRMLELQTLQQPGAVLGLMASLPRAAAPGTRWNYSTGETHVLGALLQAAIRRPLAHYLAEKIWLPCGMESAASWWLESPDGLEVGGSGLSATLRDYGRFGMFLASGGVVGTRRILPDGWLADASTPKVVGGVQVPYGYMLWPIDDPAVAAAVPGAAQPFEARGIFGQYIYMNPAERVVVIVWSAWPKPQHKPTVEDDDFFAAVATALRG